jgi:hypothetical protein
MFFDGPRLVVVTTTTFLPTPNFFLTIVEGQRVVGEHEIAGDVAIFLYDRELSANYGRAVIVTRPCTTPTPTTTSATPTVTECPCAQCPGDTNADGKVTVDEIIRAADHALHGCPQ